MPVPVIDFPIIAPKGERRLAGGSFTSHAYQFASGASNVRNIGTTEGELTLSVDFGNVEDTSVALIMQAYNSALGGTYRVRLPSEVFLGIGVDIIDLIPLGVTWRFSSAPSVRSVQPGWSSVQVEFIGGEVFWPQ